MRCLLLLICLLASSVAQAWGDIGHRVVCEIAFQELNRTARRAVVALMRSDPDYRSFSAACNWPDEPRKRDIEHYVNVPRSLAAITLEDCPLADACLFSAIRSDYARLADSGTSAAVRLDALRFLGHWVGDMHQPMHVSYQDDRGANSIEVAGELCAGSLHFAWDDCLVRESLGTNARRIARRLRDAVSPVDRERWQRDAPAEWANESYQLAIAPAAEYCTRQQGACWYAADNLLLQRGEARRTVRVDDDYVASHADTVRERLTQAGIRLGALLNATLGEQGVADRR